MGVILAPIVEGKLDAWKDWIGELNGPRKAELGEFDRRYNLTKHSAWLAETPMGAFVVVIHEGPGAGEVMGKVGKSDHEFDKWFSGKVLELHGMDVTKPPPGPLPELYLGS